MQTYKMISWKVNVLSGGNDYRSEFDAMVNHWVHQGWTPVGGVSVAMSGTTEIYAQALVMHY